MVAKRKPRFLATGLLTAASLGVCVLVAVLVWKARSGSTRTYEDLESLPHDSSAIALDEEVTARVEAFCGDCHSVPNPENLPRNAWYPKVLRG